MTDHSGPESHTTWYFLGVMTNHVHAIQRLKRVEQLCKVLIIPVQIIVLSQSGHQHFNHGQP